jgi:DNA-binding transcriptional regulator YiaG
MGAVPTLDEVLAQVRREELPPPATRALLRRQAGLTQRQVADVLGVHRITVTRWEQGWRSPRGRLRREYRRLLDRLMQEVAGT